MNNPGLTGSAARSGAGTNTNGSDRCGVSPWTSWCYHYGVGMTLLMGSLVVLSRLGVLSGDAPARRVAWTLVAGCVLFASVHAAWIALASP